MGRGGWRRRASEHPTLPLRALPAPFLLAGCASPSTQGPLQLLLASGSQQEGGHGGTSPFRHSSALTCTRPGPQPGGRWTLGGVRITGGPVTFPTAPPPWDPTLGCPCPAQLPYLHPLGRAAGRRVPSRARPQGRGHHHSWAGGPHNSSGDSDGHPHRRHCRTPRPPSQPMPQPLCGKKERTWTRSAQGDTEGAGESKRQRRAWTTATAGWPGQRHSFLSCPGKPPLDGRTEAKSSRCLPG